MTQRPPPLLHLPYAGGTTHCCAARNEITKSNGRKTMQDTMDTRREKFDKQAVRQADKTNGNTRQGDNRGSYANEQRSGATNISGCGKGRAGGSETGGGGPVTATDTYMSPPLYFITSPPRPPCAQSQYRTSGFPLKCHGILWTHSRRSRHTWHQHYHR